MPIVSIIIPAFNTSKFIGECINSILNQDFSDWELIIVDDGSTDNTKSICENFASSNKKIKVISQPNQGVSVARNNGLSIACCEFIMFVDADDILPQNSLRVFSQALEQNPEADLIRGEYEAIDVNGTKLFTSNKNVFNKSKLYRLSDNNKFYLKYLKGEYFLWLLWIRRSCINKATFKAGQIYMEDTRFLFDIMANIRNCVYVPKVIYQYRKYPGAASSSLNHKKIEDIADLSLHLTKMATESNRKKNPAILKAITDCWNLIFNYIRSLQAIERTDLIQELNLQDKAKECVSECGNLSSDIYDFANKDIETFVQRFSKREKLRSIMNKASKCTSYLKARL